MGGSFTEASKGGKTGFFELAHQGTIFLDEIIPLFKYFVFAIARRWKQLETKITLSREFETALLRYSWPGNVRELENLVEKYMTLLQIDTKENVENLLKEKLRETDNSCEDILWEGALKEIESRIITDALEQEDHNISWTAARLQIDRNTLKRKLSEN